MIINIVDYIKVYEDEKAEENQECNHEDFSREDIAAARETLVDKAKNGNIEAYKYIIEHSRSRDDDGVSFDW